MTLIRVLLLAILLGAGVSAFVWFAWGAVENVLAARVRSKGDTPEPARR